MKVTLLAVVALTAVTFAGAADPECVYRKLRNLSAHWPNPTSCSKYYRCSAKNVLREVTCAAGKEYNPKNGKCGTAGRGLCKLSLAAPLADADNVCTDQIDGVYLPKAGYCADFYICKDQEAYPQICSAGDYFTSDLNCQKDTTTECWQNFCIGKADGDLIADSASCLSYYQCQDQATTLLTCGSGSYFDPTLKTCTVDTDNSHCWENLCLNEADGTILPNANNCTSFYACSSNKPKLQECPAGSYFSKVDNGCIPGECPDDNTTEPCETETPVTTEPCEEETTEAPAGCDCADGTKNGNMTANKDNCRLFYICDNGNLVDGDCQVGNFFDGSLGACMPDTTNCCPDSGSGVCTNDDTLVKPDNCAQYYVCKAGSWQSADCVAGSYYDTDLRSCTPDINNVCADSGSTAECNANDKASCGSDCWHYNACIDGKWEEEACGSGQYFDVDTGICIIDTDGKCPENPASKMRSKRNAEAEEADCNCPDGTPENTMVPHPTDCDKYLICQGAQLIEGSCGAGNVYSNCSQACVPDTDATCWICGNKPNGFLIPNASKCNSYYTCYNGLATETTCPSGQWFNYEECVIDITASCINPCSGCATGNEAHPICSKYYSCQDGAATVVNCPSGQGFDATTKLCSSTVACNATLCETASDGTTYAISGDNTQFYVCLNNEASIRSCPVNHLYDANLGLCLAQTSCSCDQSVCATAAEDYAYPSQNGDNTTFCLCQNGGGYLESCDQGYSFDATVGICTFLGPCNPQVCVDSTDPYQVGVNYDDPNSFCLCRVGEPIPVPCPRGYTFDPTLLLCVLIPQPDPRCCSTYCVGKVDDVTFPAINLPNGFCLCESEVPVYRSCPGTKKYDALLGLCLDFDEEATNGACDASQCEILDNYDPYPALNTTAGFCYCTDLVPKFVDCPTGKTFDAELKMCLQADDPCISSVCDATQCATLEEYQPYPANNGTDGFCYCVNGNPVYRECPDGKKYADGLCQDVVDECTSSYCDATKCTCLPEYDPYPSSKENDPSGFCYCLAGEPVYNQCDDGKVFDADEKLCIKPVAPCSVCDPNGCANQPDEKSFAAYNTTTGFCLCLSGKAYYDDCPDGKTFDSTVNICMTATVKVNKLTVCNSISCLNRVPFQPFEAAGTTDGFCSCDGRLGTASYHECSNGHKFDIKTGMCIIELIACEFSQCLNRTSFEPFAARNTTTGFCTCDSLARTVAYRECAENKVFDGSRGMCMIQNSVCDPLACKYRAQFEPFVAKNTTTGFCSCNTVAGTATYFDCAPDHVFDGKLGLCVMNEHFIQKRSVDTEENVRSFSVLKKFFKKLAPSF